ncbi:hypothetical protein SGPA1_30584 [Streptomyces misionensis JCM 4497]
MRHARSEPVLLGRLRRLRVCRLPGARERRTLAGDPGPAGRAAYGRLGDGRRRRGAVRPRGQRTRLRVPALAPGTRTAVAAVRGKVLKVVESHTS